MCIQRRMHTILQKILDKYFLCSSVSREENKIYRVGLCPLPPLKFFPPVIRTYLSIASLTCKICQCFKTSFFVDKLSLLFSDLDKKNLFFFKISWSQWMIHKQKENRDLKNIFQNASCCLHLFIYRILLKLKS